MLNREKWKERMAAAILVCCFWNVFYPEFALTGDSYRREACIPPEEDCMWEDGCRTDYYRILEASEGEVEIRLGFLEKCGDIPSGTAQRKKAGGSSSESAGRIRPACLKG